MEAGRLPATLRRDGAFWRRFAELGCVYGPEWWKRGSPPVIAAILYVLGRRQRAAVRRNQRQVCGPAGWLREHWRGYRVFAEFARSFTEGMEQWGPRPKPLDLTVVGARLVEEALEEHRGLVVVTGHFGSWEVGARVLARLGRRVNMVTAQEPNPSVREFNHAVRTRHGFDVIYSDRSLFAGLPIVQALRRDEIVGMQIEPWGPLAGSHEIDFCGQPTRVQLGPFTIARVARAPVVAVFAVRTGIRRYELRVEGRWNPKTPADSIAALTEAVRAYERLIRQHPQQWLMVEDVWPASPPAPAQEIVPQAVGLRRR
ncbi:MAG TPA: lysophospholipid acyltransferase family protein [Candidatus Limnocylindria bacterium]|nr:lysophospholipid acyltransferase family protein [Candidatus Limnocylindria bacterium]